MQLLEEMTWVEVEEYLKGDKRIILVIGSCEQHGHHLPLETDTSITYAFAKMLSERTGVILAPPLNYGLSDTFMAFPGTISLQPSTFMAVLNDVVSSLYQHGFRHVLIVNGHGENLPGIECTVTSLLNRLPDLQVKASSWFMWREMGTIIDSFFQRRDGHAGVTETSVSLAFHPELVRLEKAGVSSFKGKLWLTKARDFRQRCPYGNIGIDPKNASKELGQKILDTAMAIYLPQLEEWD